MLYIYNSPNRRDCQHPYSTYCRLLFAIFRGLAISTDIPQKPPADLYYSPL